MQGALSIHGLETPIELEYRPYSAWNRPWNRIVAHTQLGIAHGIEKSPIKVGKSPALNSKSPTESEGRP